MKLAFAPLLVATLLAARLLERGNDTIASVSIHSGFGSPDTLRRHFVQARGVTPDQYRRAFRLTEPEYAEINAFLTSQKQ